MVGEVVREWRTTTVEVFLPLSHRPGEAQFDFGEAEVVLQGSPTKVAYCVMSLPYSDAFFVQVFPRNCTETFQAGRERAFEFFGGVPRRISYDNSRIAVAKFVGKRDRVEVDGRKNVETPSCRALNTRIRCPKYTYRMSSFWIGFGLKTIFSAFFVWIL